MFRFEIASKRLIKIIERSLNQLKRMNEFCLIVRLKLELIVEIEKNFETLVKIQRLSR